MTSKNFTKPVGEYGLAIVPGQGGVFETNQQAQNQTLQSMLSASRKTSVVGMYILADTLLIMLARMHSRVAF